MLRSFLLLCCLPALAGAVGPLAFESQRLALTVTQGTAEVSGEFRFTVTGNNPVTIRNAHASCGCTVPDLERRAYQPGETGVITAKYHPGSRQGRQTVRIAVTTDSPLQPNIELFLDVDIPEMVSINPRIIFWGQGEAPTPKVIEIAVNTPEPHAVRDVIAANEDFTVALEEVEAGRKYRVLVTPRATDGPYRAVLRWSYEGTWTGPAPTAYALIR